MIDRLIRAVRLDRTLYRMVADNPEYNNEATLVAVVVSLVAALNGLASARPIQSFLVQAVIGILFGWLLWAMVAYLVGSRFFKGRSTANEMMRTLAYAGVPRLLGVFGFIPCVGWIAALAGGVLSIIAGVIAIREAMEFDTTSAIITAIVGFLLYLLATIILGAVFAPLAAIGA